MQRWNEIKEFKDGIAFYNENNEEIVFYSNILDKVRYYNMEISYECNLEIMNEIKRYKRCLECNI